MTRSHCLLHDLIQIIDEFLGQEISLLNIQKWIKKHPCWCKPGLCQEKDLLLLEKFQQLASNNSNFQQWQQFKKYLQKCLETIHYLNST